MTQAILSSLDGDEVNTISDTVEATQVANVIRNSYYDIISSLNLPEHKDLFELTASSSGTPTVMTLPDNVLGVEWLKYNNYTTDDPVNRFLDVAYVDIHEFLTRAYELNPSETYIDTCSVTTNGSDTLTLNYRNDTHPKCYTTFDDNKILFDSYDVAEDSFVQKNKTQAFGPINPTFTLTDAFTPDLDSRQFTLLLNEAKSQAFIELKQQANPKSEKRARRGWIKVQQTQNAVKRGTSYTGYGRK
jgi:hypothetical protein